jgi:hypothetical protein
MFRIGNRLIVALITFLLGVAITTVFLINRSTVTDTASQIDSTQNGQAPRLLLPNDGWEQTLFIIINKRTREANLPSLRTVTLSGDDLEVRVWVGFGIYGEDALILRRMGGQWSALHRHGMAERPPFIQSLNTLIAPRSGWEKAWERLEDSGILTLPDASAVQCNRHSHDGTVYVVETNVNSTYRTYMYANPNPPKCSESKLMIEIGEIIAEEFSLEEFKIKE